MVGPMITDVWPMEEDHDTAFWKSPAGTISGRIDWDAGPLKARTIPLSVMAKKMGQTVRGPWSVNASSRKEQSEKAA